MRLLSTQFNNAVHSNIEEICVNMLPFCAVVCSNWLISIDQWDDNNVETFGYKFTTILVACQANVMFG